MKNATLVSLFVGALLAVSFISTAFAAWNGSVDSWPASGDAVKISGSLESVMPNIEPSGLAWHSGRNQLLVVGDEGELAAMNVDGSNVSTWNVGGDLEDVAVADPSSSYVYLADENGKIVKFDLSSGTTVQSWSVTTWMPEVSCGSWGTCGMEALTYADGYFYAGYQYTGEIFVLDLSGSTAVKVAEWSGLSDYGYTNVNGLHYRDGYLYALYSWVMAVMDTDGTVLEVYYVKGSAQEGLALGNDSNGDGDADMFIAQDTGGVYGYDEFPLYGWSAPAPEHDPEPVDPDSDGDGVAASLDCNDADASVSVYANFYTDADLDTLGSDTVVSLCSASAPSAYSSNSNDTNDSISNYNVEIKGDRISNDNDTTIDERNTVSQNGYHPYFGTLDPAGSSSGKITGYWGLINGYYAVRYADNSVYEYRAFNTRTRTLTKLRLNSGGYLNVTLGSSTVTVNGYTGITR